MQIDAIVFQRWLKMDWSCKVSKCHVHILWMDGKLVTLLLLLHVYHWQVTMHHYVQMHEQISWASSQLALVLFYSRLPFFSGHCWMVYIIL